MDTEALIKERAHVGQMMIQLAGMIARPGLEAPQGAVSGPRTSYGTVLGQDDPPPPEEEERAGRHYWQVVPEDTALEMDEDESLDGVGDESPYMGTSLFLQDRFEALQSAGRGSFTLTWIAKGNPLTDAREFVIRAKEESTQQIQFRLYVSLSEPPLMRLSCT